MWSAAAAARRAALHRHAGQLATAETAAHDVIDIQIRLGYRADLAGSLETLAGLAAAHGSFIDAAQRTGTAHALRKRLGFTLHIAPQP